MLARFRPDPGGLAEGKPRFLGFSQLALGMQHHAAMDWTTIAGWGLMAGLTACGVAAFDWLEARTEQRRRVERLRESRPR
jgi:hypothetical protein